MRVNSASCPKADVQIGSEGWGADLAAAYFLSLPKSSMITATNKLIRSESPPHHNTMNANPSRRAAEFSLNNGGDDTRPIMTNKPAVFLAMEAILRIDLSR